MKDKGENKVLKVKKKEKEIILEYFTLIYRVTKKMTLPGGPYTLERIDEECVKRREDIEEVMELYDGEESNLVFFLVEWKWKEWCSFRWITVYQKCRDGWWYKFALMDNTGSTLDIERHLRSVYLGKENTVHEASTGFSSGIVPGSKRDPNRGYGPNRRKDILPIPLNFNQ